MAASFTAFWIKVYKRRRPSDGHLRRREKVKSTGERERSWFKDEWRMNVIQYKYNDYYLTSNAGWMNEWMNAGPCPTEPKRSEDPTERRLYPIGPDRTAGPVSYLMRRRTSILHQTISTTAGVRGRRGVIDVWIKVQVSRKPCFHSGPAIPVDNEGKTNETQWNGPVTSGPVSKALIHAPVLLFTSYLRITNTTRAIV